LVQIIREKMATLNAKSALFTTRPRSSSNLSKELVVFAESLGSLRNSDVAHSTIENLSRLEFKKPQREQAD